MASISARSLGVAAPGRLPQEIQRITAQGGPLRQTKILTKIFVFCSSGRCPTARSGAACPNRSSDTSRSKRAKAPAP